MPNRVWALLNQGLNEEVVRGQSRPPERTITFAELRAGAFDAPPDWLWVLDASVHPAPGCLEALLAAVESLDGLPMPALVASRVESADPLAQPVPRIDKELEVAAAERGLVAVRAVPTASFLVRPASVDDSLERGELFAFSARLLRDSAGYLAPASEATLTGPVPGGVAARARTLTGGVWRGPELVWFALQLMRSALVRTPL